MREAHSYLCTAHQSWHDMGVNVGLSGWDRQKWLDTASLIGQVERGRGVQKLFNCLTVSCNGVYQPIKTVVALRCNVFIH